MADPVYTTVEKYKAWLPQRQLAELTNDNSAFTVDDPIIKEAIIYSEGKFESYIQMRDDIPIPAKNFDGSVNPEIIGAIHDMVTARLYSRRGHVPESVQQQYTDQLAWLNDISRRRANVRILGENDVEVTKTTELPVVDSDISKSKRENLFDDFSY